MLLKEPVDIPDILEGNDKLPLHLIIGAPTVSRRRG